MMSVPAQSPELTCRDMFDLLNQWSSRRACLALLLLMAQPLAADTLYVDNRVGDDAFDARSPRAINAVSGPTRSITRALSRAGAGDTVIIANHGIPYYETLTLEGSRFSGAGGNPFIIVGNGALISGSRRMRPDAWEYEGSALWKFTPVRKGHYLLLEGNAPLPEKPLAHGAPALPTLATKTWCAWRGSIYYQAGPDPGQTPADLPLAFAYEQVGITLYDVQNVIIRDLTITHFRLDGVNAHDRCQGVILQNVKLLENGRAGLAVGGSSLVGLKDSMAAGNRVSQLLISEKAQTEVLNSPLKEGPGVPFQIRGGHLLIDGREAFDPVP